jgi:hypothetical protein
MNNLSQNVSRVALAQDQSPADLSKGLLKCDQGMVKPPFSSPAYTPLTRGFVIKDVKSDNRLIASACFKKGRIICNPQVGTKPNNREGAVDHYKMYPLRITDILFTQ